MINTMRLENRIFPKTEHIRWSEGWSVLGELTVSVLPRISLRDDKYLPSVHQDFKIKSKKNILNEVHCVENHNGNLTDK